MKRNSTLARVPERERQNSEVANDKQSNKTCRELQNERRFGFINGFLSLDAPCDREAFLILHKRRDMHLQRKSGRLAKEILLGHISIAPTIPNLRIHGFHQASSLAVSSVTLAACSLARFFSSVGSALRS